MNRRDAFAALAAPLAAYLPAVVSTGSSELPLHDKRHPAHKPIEDAMLRFVGEHGGFFNIGPTRLLPNGELHVGRHGERPRYNAMIVFWDTMPIVGAFASSNFTYSLLALPLEAPRGHLYGIISGELMRRYRWASYYADDRHPDELKHWRDRARAVAAWRRARGLDPGPRPRFPIDDPSSRQRIASS